MIYLIFSLNKLKADQNSLNRSAPLFSLLSKIIRARGFGHSLEVSMFA